MTASKRFLLDGPSDENSREVGFQEVFDGVVPRAEKVNCD